MPTCSSCSGTGSVTWIDTGTRHPCLSCNGTGFINEQAPIGGGGSGPGPRRRRQPVDPVTNTIRLLVWIVAGFAAWLVYERAENWIYAVAALFLIGMPLGLVEKNAAFRAFVGGALKLLKWAIVIGLVVLVAGFLVR